MRSAFIHTFCLIALFFLFGGCNPKVIPSELSGTIKANFFEVISLEFSDINLKDSYIGDIDGKEVVLQKSTDTTLVFIVPDLMTGKYTLDMELGTYELDITQTVIGNTDEFIAGMDTQIKDALDALVESDTLPQDNIRQIVEFHDEMMREYHLLTSEEKKEVAAILQNNLDKKESTGVENIASLSLQSLSISNSSNEFKTLEGMANNLGSRWEALDILTQTSIGIIIATLNYKIAEKAVIDFIKNPNNAKYLSTVKGLIQSLKSSAKLAGKWSAIVAAGVVLAYVAVEYAMVVKKFKEFMRELFFIDELKVELEKLNHLFDFKIGLNNIVISGVSRAIRESDRSLSPSFGRLLDQRLSLNTFLANNVDFLGISPVEFSSVQEQTEFVANEIKDIQVKGNSNVLLERMGGNVVKLESNSGVEESFNLYIEVEKGGLVLSEEFPAKLIPSGLCDTDDEFLNLKNLTANKCCPNGELPYALDFTYRFGCTPPTEYGILPDFTPFSLHPPLVTGSVSVGSCIKGNGVNAANEVSVILDYDALYPNTMVEVFCAGLTYEPTYGLLDGYSYDRITDTNFKQLIRNHGICYEFVVVARQRIGGTNPKMVVDKFSLPHPSTCQ